MRRLSQIESDLAAPVQVRVSWDKTVAGSPPPITAVECIGHHQMRADALAMMEVIKVAAHLIATGRHNWDAWNDYGPVCPFCGMTGRDEPEHTEYCAYRIFESLVDGLTEKDMGTDDAP
jgi:hypothetical protein